MIGEWLTAGVTPRAAVDGREWTLPGWFDEACDWLRRALADAGAGEVDEIVQLRAWAFSCVLRVRTGTGTFYFKAVPESIGRECAVTEYLARHFPGAIARVVATNPERRWFLMNALAGAKLEDTGDVTAWERAVTVYGQLQLACIERVHDLAALGCPTRGLDALAAEIEGLSDRLHGRGPELRRRCERLAACGIPLTLEHGDLWPGNFLVDAASCAIIDWEDVAIGHPFFSLAPLIVGLHMFQPRLASREVTQRLERAYVSCFAGLASPERLLEALRLAGPLGLVDMAVRYRHQRPSVVRLHPWMRDLVPEVVRFALVQLDSEKA